MDITVNVSGRGLKAVAVDIQNRMSQMQFPLEYHAAVLGDYASAQAARNRMLGILLVTLVGIFFMLQAAFGSWLLAGVFLLALPAALAGGMLAVLTGGSILSIGSLAGFLAAFAIASRNGMLIINHYQHLQRFEGEEFGPTLALRGASERMAPVFMTTLAVIFAFLPALFLGDIPGLEVMRPMAAVLVGGMITALLVNLFILPVLYLSLGIRPEPEMDLEGIQPMPSTPLKAPELGTGD
jgi:Cu/Ag efflux pump CusA